MSSKKQQETTEGVLKRLKEKESKVDLKLQALEPYLGLLLKEQLSFNSHNVSFNSPKELRKICQGSLTRHELHFNETVSNSYFISLITAFHLGRFVLLNGTVGVGKTRIIRDSAKLLGGQSRIIPVRPAWLDPSDLLGFYDPIQEIFRPEPFLTAMKEAKENEDIFHLVCLDELNLAKVENYASDLLSCLEYSKNQEDSEGLALYSQDIWENLKEECELLYKLEVEKQSIKEEQRLKRLHRFFRDYPSHKFEIPNNLVLFGTINSDETTYDLSPKFIDRSLIITYPTVNLTQEIREQQEISSAVSVKNLSQEITRCKESNNVKKEFGQKLEVIQNWNEQYFHKGGIGRPFGYRVKQDLEVFMAISNLLDLSVEECFSHFIFVKILPRVYFFKNSSTEINKKFENWLNEVEDYIEYDPASVVDNLGTQLEDSQRQVVSYWD